MESAARYVEFIHLPSYRRAAEGLLDEDDQRTIEQQLVVEPRAGAVMVGTGGVRKLRVAVRGRGKSGGARLIYYYRESKGRIYLVFVYPKGRKDNLTPAERAAMKRLTAQLENET